MVTDAQLEVGCVVGVCLSIVYTGIEMYKYSKYIHQTIDLLTIHMCNHHIIPEWVQGKNIYNDYNSINKY